jgi:hypothetical protein
MVDPLKNLSEMQTAWFQAWAAATRHSLEMWRHTVDMQHNFLHHAAKHTRGHVEIATGASLTDKYGKRSHDIDPERDV